MDTTTSEQKLPAHREFWIASRIIGPAQIFLAVGSQQIAFHRVPDG